ncbi:MAG: ATP-binding cassette domain-containing protein, partial [Gammaproteobacteria bacterium]|nr:ATP-binding cassette domain-containing protein [Gammaproteobacteria bacterium]
MSETLLEVRDLRTYLGSAEEPVRAVDGVGFEVRAGETFALLGESGCGKSMTAFSLMRLLPAGGRIVSGEIRFQGRDILRIPETAMRGLRGGAMAMVFQEPMTSLNPVMTIGDQIGEAVRRHRGLAGRELQGEVRA